MKRTFSYAVLVFSIFLVAVVQTAAAYPRSAQSSALRSAAIVDSARKEANAGDAGAMNFLGILYAEGKEVEQSYSTAHRWFSKAAAKGLVDAMNNVAVLHLHGLGIPQSYDKAGSWFRRSAKKGSAYAMDSLAFMSDNGLGTPKDARRAGELYLQASEHGYAPAMLTLSERYEHGRGVERDLVRAYAWVEVAQETGLPPLLTQVALAKLHRLGSRLDEGTKIDAGYMASQLVTVVKVRTRSLSKPTIITTDQRV